MPGRLRPIGYFFIVLPPPPRSTLFPYSTLFRSDEIAVGNQRERLVQVVPLVFRQRVEPALERDLVTVRPADRKSTRLNSSHRCISYAVFCLKKKTKHVRRQ